MVAGLTAADGAETPIVTYCKAGIRAAVAKTMLERAGYRRVVNGGGLVAQRAQLDAVCASCGNLTSTAVALEDFPESYPPFWWPAWAVAALALAAAALAVLLAHAVLRRRRLRRRAARSGGGGGACAITVLELS